MKPFSWIVLSVIVSSGFLVSCGSGVSTVTGTASFILGASSVTRSPQKAHGDTRLLAGDEYLISPNKAKITFTSIAFRNSSGDTISTATLSGCVVTYDRSSVSGTSLLDCPFDVPVGEIAQLSVGFSTTLQVLVNDTTTNIYSDSTSPTGFTTTAGTPDFVDFVATAGASSTERSTPIIFATPITVTAGSTPKIYITTDMIHGIQLKVDSGGTTLSVPTLGTQDPVALFGGFSKGTSMYFSEDTTVDSVKVAGKKSLRIFYDADGNPLYLIGFTCGVDGPKGAWASPPIGSTLGGWLGKDSLNKIAWALPVDTSYATYSAYFLITTVGLTTTVDCKATASPPEPADGKTYASGAPTMSSPTTSPTLNLLAK